MAETPRKILHCDMDAFFASVEQRDDPGLRGKPVAVGGGERRGVVMAASYEARVYGVRSAMPGRSAARACPELIFIQPRMNVYRETGAAVREIFRRYTELVEPLSLDEAYLDVTEFAGRNGLSATAIAEAIKEDVRRELRLTVSAGVSSCKFVAKIASGWRKPDGLTVVPPAQVAAFVAALPIGKFHGVGPATAAKLAAMGVRTGADLGVIGEALLVQRLGKFGTRLHQLAQGVDERQVEPNRDSKSIGAERTFDTDISGPAALRDALEPVLLGLTTRLGRSGHPAWRTLTLKIRTEDFRTATRSRTFPAPQGCDETAVREIALALLHAPHLPLRPVRLLGLSCSNFVQPGGQGQLALPLEEVTSAGR